MTKIALQKGISFLFLTLLLFCYVVCSSYFVTTLLAQKFLGSFSLLLVALQGILFFFLALIYAELSSFFTFEGGVYAYARSALGDFTGFIIGWGNVLLFCGGAGVYTYSLTLYMGNYFPTLLQGDSLSALGYSYAVLFLWGICLLHILGLKVSRLIILLAAFFMIAFILVFIMNSFFFLEGRGFSADFVPSWKGVIFCVPMIFWMFTGFDVAIIPSEEVIAPKKNIPKAIITSYVLVFLLAVFLSFCVNGTSLPGKEEIMEAPKNIFEWSSISADQLVGKINNPLSVRLIYLCIPIFLAGTVISVLFSQSRILFALGRERFFPSLLGKLHERFFTPTYAIIFGGILSTGVLLTIPDFPLMTQILFFPIVLINAIAGLALVVLRKKHQDAPKTFTLPFGKTVCLFNFIFCSILSYLVSWPGIFFPSLLFLVAVPLYLFFQRKKENWLKNFWILFYLVGICVISFLGTTYYPMEKTLGFSALEVLVFPYDMLVVTLFSSFMFFLGYFLFTKRPRQMEDMQHGTAIKDIN